jgi:oligosaccharide repeat unit polymerase
MITTLLVTKIKYKTIIKSNVLFTGMWCICAGVASLGIYGLYKPSSITQFYSITAILTFNTFFLLHNRLEKKILFKNFKGTARLKLIFIANTICWIYISAFMPMALNIISLYGFKGLRMYAFDSGMGLATTLELTIIQWLVQPVFVATILIAVIYIVIGRKTRVLTLVALTDVIIYTILFGGRYMMVRMMMYYILAFLILKSSHLEQLKKKKINMVFIGAIITSVIILTSQRNWGDTSFIKNTIIYYIGSFSFLDAVLSAEHYVGVTDFLFGKATLGFIYNLIITPFTLLFQLPYLGSDYLITQVTSVPRLISPTQTYNAMTTILYPFLRDFGYLGIIIGTIFLAWFISIVEKMFHRTNHLLFLCVYVYLGFVLFDSVMSYQLLFPAAGVTLLYLFLFLGPKFKLGVK